MFTAAETLLIIGTFGICLGVWMTLAVIIGVNRENFKRYDTLPSPPPPPDEELFESDQPSDSVPPDTMEAATMTASGCGCGGNCKCGKKG